MGAHGNRGPGWSLQNRPVVFAHVRRWWWLLLVGGCGLPPAPVEPRADRSALELEPGNLVLNPSFEDAGGWTDYRCTTAFEANAAALHGTRLARLTMTSASGQFDIDDSLFVATDVDAGVRFVASAWIAAGNAAARGGEGFIALRERNSQGSNVGVREGRVVLDGGFNRVEVRFTTTTTGGEVDVYVGQIDGVSGGQVLIDLVQAFFDVDAGAPDAGAPDAGPPDAGSSDAGAVDAGVADAGAPDSGAVDAGFVLLDAGPGSIDGGRPDGGEPPSVSPLALDVACGCQAANGLVVLPGALLLRRRRRG